MATIIGYYEELKNIQNEYNQKWVAISANYETVKWGRYLDARVALVSVGYALAGSIVILPPAVGFILGGLIGYTFMVESKRYTTILETNRKLEELDRKYRNILNVYTKGGRSEW